jgi:acyl carrier protein
MSSAIDVVMECIRAVFENRGLAAPPMTGDTALDASFGLESLDYAELVVRLQDELGKDPFAVPLPPVVGTINELAALYEDEAG